MHWNREWSLAARLTAWYAIAAFLLVAAAAFFQYGTLVTSLAEEDDRLLAERLAATRDGEFAARISRVPPREENFRVRLLDATCHPLGVTVPGLPPPICPEDSPSNGVRYRSSRSFDGKLWRIASARAPGSRPGWLEILLDRSRDEGVLREYRDELALVLGAALLASVLISYAIARRGLQPLATLAERMKQVNAHSLDKRLSTHRAPAEIKLLVSSFDAMLERLEAAFRALSELSAELAHELRTPLHVLRQQSEVALGRARTAEQYRDLLASSLEELDRLGRMADDMLFLARTEDPRSSIDRQRLPIAAELRDVSDYLEALAAEAHVTLEVDAPASLCVLADRMLLRRALVNVVTNSLSHTPPGGRVRLSARAEGSSVIARIDDDGAGIPPDILPRVFDRYFRASSSQGSPKNGSGLGLAIVRGIMQLHGGTVTIASTPGQNTAVSLSFPRAQSESIR